MNKITQKQLSDYLGVTPQAVADYKKTPIGKKKLDLMLKGLALMQLKQIDLQRLKNEKK